MGTIEDEIGRTNYNAFRDAEKWGHTVIRRGKGRNMRIWLVHRDDEVPEKLSHFAAMGIEEVVTAPRSPGRILTSNG